MKTITNLFNGVKGLIGITSVALILPLSAIENPAAENAPKENKKKEAAAAEEAPKEKEAAKKVAMIGLGGNSVSETLSIHLGLEEGNGLTIYHIVPGSAAAKAGLQEHDVLTEFQGKKIGSQQDLRDAVLAQKPGDEVTVKYIHKGKAEEKKIVLGERVDMPRIQPIPGMNPWKHGGFGNIPEADRKRIEEEMKKHMKDIEKQLGEGGMQLDLQGLLNGAQNGAPKGKAVPRKMNFNFGGASVTMMDGDGSVTMKTVDGKKEVIVKDKAGKVVFEGPYQTEQDKAAVPDDIRDRLDKMNFGENGMGGLRLQIGPGGIMPPPEEPEEDEAAE